jgi:hypothetical protein
MHGNLPVDIDIHAVVVDGVDSPVASDGKIEHTVPAHHVITDIDAGERGRAFWPKVIDLRFRAACDCA